MLRRPLCTVVLVFAWMAPSLIARGEEGMWLLTAPPTEAIQKTYGLGPSAAWLEHVQKSCVRFGRGGSASLVSASGLVMTNHHVGYGQIEKLSTKERNFLTDGFYAARLEDELKCPDLEVSVLWSIEDVTERVNEPGKGLSAADANTARQKRIAEIEKECQDTTGLHGDVVTLYHGAKYHLYRYRRYTDVRLVMAPEENAASFGGDVDNFEYPRFNLDMSFFRIYENDRPLRPEHYFKWNATGAGEGDLVFVAGHPARTQRSLTLDHVRFLRDVQFPPLLQFLWRREVQLINFSARSEENARIAQGDLKGVQNSRKAYTGMLGGLHDPGILRAKLGGETRLRKRVESNLEYERQWSSAWNEIKESLKTYKTFVHRYQTLEGRGSGGGSRLLSIGETLVRLAAEKPKPDGDRLRGYHDADLDSLNLRLYSPAPIYDELEIDKLASWFSYMAETFGGDDTLLSKMLSGKSPRARAVELVSGTKLKEVEVRRKLAEGGMEAITSSDDPIIRLAYDIDSEGRALIKRYEDEVEGPQTQGYAKVAAARFAIEGENVYPDATGTLRLTYGSVKGFVEDGKPVPVIRTQMERGSCAALSFVLDGKPVPAFTTLGGMFARHSERRGLEPFDLPKRWLDAKDKLDLATPFNFVCTTDVIGGNSGSPVFNREGEVVGLVFDINLPALVWDTVYTDNMARTVAVDGRAIIEALRKVYHADRLITELRDGS